ncbi:MAG: efflux transporter outer membrane subunit [Burkholderiaceae bacterium]
MSDATRRWHALGMGLVLAGCAAGPDSAPPPAPAAGGFTQDDPVVVRSGATLAAQVVRAGAPVPARWWEAFDSRALDEVVEHAVAASPTLEGARATLSQAEHELAAVRGTLVPQVRGSAAAARANQGGAGTGAASLFSAGAGVEWTPDVFGGGRRRVEQARALVDYQRAQRRAARLSLVGNTVLQAIALASTREQLAAVEDILAADERNLALVELSAAAGKSAQLDVLTARSQLSSDRALLPPLRQQASAARHALAVLAGERAGNWSPPDIGFDALAMPGELPLSLPSDWLRQRPDIEAAEAQLRAANAQVGIATAALYPSFTLDGAWTATGRVPGRLFHAGTDVWSLAASLLAPVFDGGTLAAQRAAAVDAYAAQLAAYRLVLLQAFGQVADVLDQSRNDAALLDAQAQALDAAAATLALTREGYRAGQASLVQLLDAQRLYEQARLGRARALGQRFSDCAQWFIAMGEADDSGDAPVEATTRREP